MYKFLCTDAMGVNMRQNELIEMALTFDFQGIEIDMADMVGRAESMGMPFATQFVNSADVEIATYRLPLDLKVDDEAFQKELKKLDRICELSEAINGRQCYLNIASSHPSLKYHENFEKHRTRISEIADKLQTAGVRVGLQFTALPGPAGEMQFIHKPDELAALVKAINHPNVGLVVDTWHWLLAGADIDTIRLQKPERIFEVRLADPPEGAKPEKVERGKRGEPGTHPDSLAQATLDWLREIEFESPVGLSAHIPRTPGNAGDLLWQRIGKVLDQMIAGTHGQQAEAAATDGDAESADGAESDQEQAVST
jgi:sugar phosphate isomerase/epimerase